MSFIEQNPGYILFGLLIGWLLWQRLVAPALSGVKNISAAEYVIMSMQPHTLLDVRQDVEWASEHAEAAMHIPLSEVGQRYDEIPYNQPIVVICASGNRSAMAATKLAKLGFTTIYNFSGGMSAWDGTLLPVKRSI
jgi:rhodanese-related sulfurtransferase